MTGMDDTFDNLSALVGAPGSKYFPRVLEALMTRDEAKILLELRDWTTTEQLAERLHCDTKSLQAKLNDMYERMIIRKSERGYITPSNVVAFHHGSIGCVDEKLKAKVYPLWGEFFFAEWGDIIVDDFVKRAKTGAPGAHRIVPAHKALKASPNIRPEQVLWYEDMEQILRRSKRTNLMMCGCRGLWGKCDSPVDVCLKVEYPVADRIPMPEWGEMSKPAKDVSFEEALAAINDCEDKGLVHIPLNTSQGDVFCNCCEDCCMVITPLLRRGNIHEILTPSRYRAAADQEMCNGCQTCIERCKFDAIEMCRVPGSKKLKSTIISENCLGCGVCVITCPTKALTMELVRPPEHIPTISVFELFAMGS